MSPSVADGRKDRSAAGRRPEIVRRNVRNDGEPCACSTPHSVTARSSTRRRGRRALQLLAIARDFQGSQDPYTCLSTTKKPRSLTILDYPIGSMIFDCNDIFRNHCARLTAIHYDATFCNLDGQ
jgi:hypothetical protein